MHLSLFSLKQCIIKQLLHSVFVISGIIKVSVSVISRSRTLTSTFIILVVTKTSSNNCLLSNHDGNANENVALKYMFGLLVVLHSYSILFNLYNVAELSWNRIGRSGVQAETENEKFAIVCLRSFHVVVLPTTMKKCTRFTMHMQGIVLLIKSYCFMTFPLPSPLYLLKLPTFS